MPFAAVSTDRKSPTRQGKVTAYKMAAVKIYKGSMVFAVSGYATSGSGSTSPTGAANLRFLGVATETVDNSGGSAGDKSINVTSEGIHRFTCSSAAQTSIGASAYFGHVDGNQTVVFSAPTGYNVVVGSVAEYHSATEVGVNINGFAGVSLTAAT